MPDAVSETTEQKQKPEHLWKPGQSGNPKGRPKGSRNRLSESVVADILADWEEHGAAAIREVRETKPSDYLKVVASILPKQAEINVNKYDDWTDDQIRRSLSAAITDLATLGVDIGLGAHGGAGAEGEAEPAGGVSTLQ